MKAQKYQSFMLLFASLVLVIGLVGGTWNTAYGAGLAVQRLAPAAFVTPTFSIVSVSVDNTVTIQTSDFPANDTFNVLMNVIHTQGVGGTQVATVNSGSGGSFSATFNIPASLKGQQQIAIRLESPTSGFFAFNWFWNNTGGVPVTGSTATPGPIVTPFTIPSFSIQSVVTDTSVTIQTANFPANDTFNVLMNTMGTRGVGGTQVATVNSGSGGSFIATYNIPASLKGQRQIAIRLESPTSGFFAFNWFWNNTSGVPVTGSTATPGPVVTPFATPSFSIQSVVRDSTVTVLTHNFPANDNFVVLMNVMHTQGIGGVQVDSFNSGAGGSFTRTFTIPTSLQGLGQISIRISSSTSGFFAFNWFWNNTAP